MKQQQLTDKTADKRERDNSPTKQKLGMGNLPHQGTRGSPLGILALGPSHLERMLS